MLSNLYPILFVFLLLLPSFVSAAGAAAPAIMHAKTLSSQVNLIEYFVTEKMDGVRAIWIDGRLITRSGKPIEAPQWFLDTLPSYSVEGELWLGYGNFDAVSALVRQHHSSDDLLWHDVTFYLFDQPYFPATYMNRRANLNQFVEHQESRHLKVVPGFDVVDQRGLDELLNTVVERGGEGLMLNSRSGFYESKRSSSILKLKPTFDDEAKVIDLIPGKGKFEGMLGALVVQMSDGRRFKIGTGFSNNERKKPPKIGQMITFEYSGLTSKGLPKFARFVRMYENH